MSPHRRLATSICLALSLAAIVGSATARGQSPHPLSVYLSGAEFPDYDADVLRQQRNGLANASLSVRLRHQPGLPELADALALRRGDDALRVLQSIVRNAPQDIPRAFEMTAYQSSALSDQARGYPDALQALVDEARQQLPGLPRELEARAARAVLIIDRRQPQGDERLSFADKLARFVKLYQGTEAALLTEVDVMQFGMTIRDRLDALDRFTSDHPGTIAAAKALYTKGFTWGSGSVYPEIEARGTDPTARLFRVLEIVKELESGRYLHSEWVERAPTLVAMFFVHEPTYAPGSIDRQLAAYMEFVKTHFVLADEFPLNDGTGYIIATRMFDLFKAKGEGIAGLERALTELERDVADATAVRFLRAQLYARSVNWEPATERSEYYQKAIRSLTALERERKGVYSRKALASLASLHFAEGDFTRARDAFRKYANAYPDTAWAWIAALRIGQCDEALGNWRAAADAHLAAASRYASTPFARVLGHAYAARAYEALGQFDVALRQHRTSLAGWDDDYGQVYSLHRTPNSKSSRPYPFRDRPDVERWALTTRIAQLERSLAVPGGALLERGRWLVDQQRYEDALTPLGQVQARFPRSPAASEARDLAHQSRLRHALQLADVNNPKPAEAAARAELDRITGDPYDFGVFAANIAIASMLSKEGATTEAESVMRSALVEWAEHQRPLRDAVRNDVENDIAEIRDVVLRASADGVLSNGTTYPRTIWPRPGSFVIVNPEIAVKFSGTPVSRRFVYHSLNGVDRVLFLNAEQQGLLSDIAAKLGNKPTRLQDAGRDVREFWDKFFPTSYRYGGVTFDDYPRVALETPPVITQLEFLNPERTRAAAHVVAGHQGGTVVLEKTNGVWVATALVGAWIS